MKYWQKTRNYRRYELEDGTFVHIITVGGEDVEVSSEVYQAYAQAERRERYQAEREVGRLLSLERLADDGMQLSHLTDKHVESAEDTAIRNLLKNQMYNALPLLSEEEQRLLYALIFGGITEREYAATLGISQVAIHKRKQRLLKKLQKMLEL
jgi:RNA polymerase sigma factor (sigma-70 family)